MVKDVLSIENMKHVDTENCFYCGKELTIENKSPWSQFSEVDGEQVLVNQCYFCEEVNNRLLSSCIKQKDGITFIPSKTIEEIIKEMVSENITDEFLHKKRLMDDLDIYDNKLEQ